MWLADYEIRPKFKLEYGSDQTLKLTMIRTSLPDKVSSMTQWRVVQTSSGVYLYQIIFWTFNACLRSEEKSRSVFYIMQLPIRLKWVVQIKFGLRPGIWSETERLSSLETRGQSNLTKSASRGPIPRLGVTPGGQNLYHWIPGVGFPISVL